jgi:hypothetical protein
LPALLCQNPLPNRIVLMQILAMRDAELGADSLAVKRRLHE